LVNALVKTYKIPQPPRVSIGQCTLSELPEPTAQNLLKRADEALYKVKADRRRASAA
jgi:GGDEF domain-containing protein